MQTISARRETLKKTTLEEERLKAAAFSTEASISREVVGLEEEKSRASGLNASIYKTTEACNIARIRARDLRGALGALEAGTTGVHEDIAVTVAHLDAAMARHKISDAQSQTDPKICTCQSPCAYV